MGISKKVSLLAPIAETEPLPTPPSPEEPLPANPYSSLAGKVHLHICVPCFGCRMRKEFLLSLLALQSMSPKFGIGLSIDTIGNESLITRGRNVLAAKFLKGPGTHLLFIDSDIAFDPVTVLRLAAVDKDIATAVYPKKYIDWNAVQQKLREGSSEPVEAMGLDYNINIQGNNAAIENGFIRVIDAATGFMLIKRDALQKVVDMYADTLTCTNDVTSTRGVIPTYVAVFETMICPNSNRYLSEDFAFCRRAQAAGLEVWADIESPLVHVGNSEIHGEPLQRFRLAYVA